jgi:hypothetical protein
MNRFVLRPENRMQFIAYITCMELSEPVQFDWKPHKSKRSVDQNALMWQWLTHMAKHFSSKGGSFEKEDMHDLMRHKFLGYNERKIGNTELPPQLKSTTDQNVAEMHHYLSQIDMWAASCGCLLPRPEDSIYDEMCREQAA